ncbi:hypothetical protein [Thalassoroseus pseudoceratinae]|uniref:hypothetical protein n=1 Tax=Thalassoroseus pseudoceratinae TaxID=2713176 RepID=UPI00141FE536|nr:hypothetical protein [Thalassoroseus pseudoceratinae]
MKRIALTLLAIGMLAGATNLTRPAYSDYDDDDGPRYRGPRIYDVDDDDGIVIRRRGYVPRGYVVPPRYPSRSYIVPRRETYIVPQSRVVPSQPSYVPPPPPVIDNSYDYNDYSAPRTVVPPPEPDDVFSGPSLSPPPVRQDAYNPPALPPASINEPVITQPYRAGQCVSTPMQCFPRVKVKDRKDIHPAAVPTNVAIANPLGPGLVFVKVFVPPFPPEKQEVKDRGRKVKLEFDDYKVEVESKDGYIEVDYDD